MSGLFYGLVCSVFRVEYRFQVLRFTASGSEGFRVRGYGEGFRSNFRFILK